jgi:hypothetical protein
MHHPIVERLDALARWREQIGRPLGELGTLLAEQDLLGEGDAAVLAALQDRLASDTLMLAFVAEFSRGKSELINAMFFGDTGRRVLPATPGRTTMCPVELRHDPASPPHLRLLPIETRLLGLSLSELRSRDTAWEVMPLDPADAEGTAQTLAAVTQTRRVSIAEAAALGFWRDPLAPGDDGQTPPRSDAFDDNPPVGADGRVEIPAWRHALIDYPHPLLQRGLVVIDTPGLNAIGAEPELTLSLLPSAHAVVFVLAADTGVTRSDLEVWRQHLGGAAVQRYAVLNKIDTLADPMASAEQVRSQIERQRESAAGTLGLPVGRVFPLSARAALAARVAGDETALAASGVPALEQALAGDLLPRRREGIATAVTALLGAMEATAHRRLADRRRQLAEQRLELRGLRGKSSGKLRLMMGRVDQDSADFERCVGRLAALRAVQHKLLRSAMARLSSDSLRRKMAPLDACLGARALLPGSRAGFERLFDQLQTVLTAVQREADEMHQMLEVSYRQLNTEFGFAFAPGAAPAVTGFGAELTLIVQNYRRCFGLGQVWRLATPSYTEQFRRMLLARLRVVFENAAGELEMWSRAANSQVEVQLRERRRAFARRRDALQRVQVAAGELEQRIAEMQAHEDSLDALQQRIGRALDGVRVIIEPSLVAAAAAREPCDGDSAFAAASSASMGATPAAKIAATAGGQTGSAAASASASEARQAA